MAQPNEVQLESMWHVPLQQLFTIARGFYAKEKDSIPLDYDQKVQLLALYKQEKYGPHSPEKDEETGYFDIIGGDRRKAWIRLGNMSKEDAQKELVQLLYKAAPQLEDYVSQQWKALKLGNLTNGKMCVNPMPQ
jgi:acyl-CoA-binding protein